MGTLRVVVAAACASGVAASTARFLGRSSFAESLARVNHAGRPVTLAEGPALVAGLTVGAAVASPAPALAAVGAGLFGAIDDFAGDSASKGLKGHLGSLARGEVTTGALKIVGIGATALVAARVADRERGVGLVDTTASAATIALGANLGNLLDLRPGRALKAGAATALPLLLGPGSSRATAAAVLGAGAAVIADDLAGRSMLGDTGANALGATIATAYASRAGTRGRLAAAAVLLGLTLASERVSFTKIIESTPGLREFDRWGRSR